MNASELKRLLKRYGCYFVKEQTGHEEWYSPITGKVFSIWRHKKEIPTGTLNAILKQSGVKR